MVYSTRRFVVCLTMCHFVLVFFSPFSITVTSLGEERANLSAFRSFVRFGLVWICRFPLPLGVWERLRFVIVALPGLFSYLFFAIKEKRRENLAAGVHLLHDNAPVHKSRVAQAAIRECKLEQLNHLPYSPDLAPSDYYLFRNLKSHLRGTRFRDDDELKAATEAWFEDQIDDFYF